MRRQVRRSFAGCCRVVVESECYKHSAILVVSVERGLGRHDPSARSVHVHVHSRSSSQFGSVASCDGRIRFGALGAQGFGPRVRVRRAEGREMGGAIL